MNSIFVPTLCLALLPVLFTDALGQGVQPVSSKNTRYQLEREVITRWGKFNPKWYFILFHNKYRKGPDRRNMLQLAPTMALVSQNRVKAQAQEEAVSQVYEQEMFKFADRSLNKGYHLLYKKKIDELNTALWAMNAEAVQAGVQAAYILAIHAERDRINADIGIVLDAYLDDAKKGEQLRVYISELTALQNDYRRLISLFKTSQDLTD
ncbi:hypothetical protein POKO110462_10300 [Pontibacter korlensis]|uniref:DUF5045 domain-containing protein n=1 Tax=Pontibacter korlensis TaxID=400092 RepID=A0A0E3UVK7_9BACT|nr:hypothetical protein [Pontibacter korlensis]AKD01911.1 hypothetical protein PKOR_00570 [Pontibacter korlensis]